MDLGRIMRAMFKPKVMHMLVCSINITLSNGERQRMVCTQRW